MDRRERIDSIETAILTALQGWQKDLWTALPGIIQSFNPENKTCEVLVSIQARQTNIETGEFTWVTLPLLVDCPVFFPSGGGYTLTFPLTLGDECLVIFASRCIDAWWQSGALSKQAVMRMHDLSDGFVFAGISAVPKVQPNISTNSVQLRTNDGDTYVELKGSVINITTPAAVNVNCNRANINAETEAKVTSPRITLQDSGANLRTLVTSTFAELYNDHTHTASGAGKPVAGSQSNASHLTNIVRAE